MDIIRRILGEAEAEDERDEKKPKAEKPKAEPKPEKSNGDKLPLGGTPEDTQVGELAKMWPGNREEVLNRFMAMSNQEAVKLVFAIGQQGALELARIADERLESQGEDDSLEAPPEEAVEPGQDLATTEPASVEAPEEAQGYPTRQILGVGR